MHATHAILVVDRSGVTRGEFTGAVYKGLALATTNSGDFLFATNFRFGTVEKFDAQFNLVASSPTRHRREALPGGGAEHARMEGGDSPRSRE